MTICSSSQALKAPGGSPGGAAARWRGGKCVLYFVVLRGIARGAGGGVFHKS